MPIEAASLLVKVGADTGGAEAAISRLSGMLGPGGILKMGAIGAIAAVAGVGVAAIHMAGDFEAGMTSLVTGAGESQSNLKLVSDGILKMATATGTSTQQLTDGMYMIESAGYHGQQGLDILKAAAEGAKVGNADLGTVADATTTILKDFGNTGITASGAVNELVATVANGKTHMADLSASLAQILPTASAAGVGLNDVMGAMATMTGEGVPAANAATYLRQMLISLDAPSSGAKKALEAVGLSSDDVAAEMKKSLPDALKLIQDHLAQTYTVGSPQYVEAIKNIAGGSRQMQGMLDLTGTHLKDFNTNVLSIGGAVQKGGNQIAGWSAVQGDFNFKLSQAKEVVQTLFIQLGTHLLPVAGDLASLFANDLPKALASLQPILDGVSKGFGDGKGLSGALDGVGKFVRSVVLPMLRQLAQIFITDVLPAAMRFAQFVQTTVLPALTKLGVFVEQKVMPIIHTLADVFYKDVLPAVEQVAGVILTKLLPPLEHILGKVLPVLNPLLRFLGWLFKNVIGPAITGVVFIISGLLTALSWIIDRVGDVLGWLGSMIGKLNDVGSAFTGVGTLAQGVWHGIQQGVKNGINVVIGLVNDFIGFIDGIHIKIPSVGVGPFHSPALNIGFSIPKIPQLATGGDILSDGLSWVGERGPELVGLPAGARVYNHQQSAAMSAGSGQQGAGQTVPIILQVDGRRLAAALLPYQPGVIASATGVRKH